MTPALDRKIATCLKDVRPRKGFGAELLAALTEDPSRLHALEAHGHRSRAHWVVAGALAGVVSATGVVYLAARKHRGAA